ncbi:serine hydrolase domain-containing protein [Nocardia sp. NPDC059240]|uniref:serine hydrolase domain-containing protein n=1 Tax=Nocardia sp. NPDC059240 TaxID=3346786 RepID=UPI00367FF5D0
MRIGIGRAAAAIALACVGVLVSACAPAPGGGVRGLDAALTAKIDAIVAEHLAGGLFPGAEVAIVDPDRGTYVHAYGLADTVTKRAADVSDHFRIGSITKTFTATAVLRLADSRRIKLTDTLEQYVPGVPNGTTITLADLLGMRGGVYALDQDKDFLAQALAPTPATAWNDGDTLRAITAHPELAKPPNQQTHYSNSEFYLLGLVLEKVTGKPVREVLDDTARDFALTGTTYTADNTLPAPYLSSYSFDQNTLVDVTNRVPPSLYGAAGSMVSTISDLALYGPQLGMGSLLTPETFRARTTFTPLDGGAVGYGLGMMRAGQWLGHTGATLGFTSQLGYLPDKRVTVVVAVNQYGPATRQLLPIDATALWLDLVDALYPGTSGTPASDPAVKFPAVPSTADIDARLVNSLQSAPASETALRIAGDSKGDIMRAWAAANATDPTRYQIQGVHVLRPDLLIANGTLTDGSVTSPFEMPLIPADGEWRVMPTWICQFLLGAERPAACDSPAGQ